MRHDNNWQDFAPLLDENLQLVRESAQIRAEILGKSAYDILLDDFSPGLSQQVIDPIFDELKSFLPGFIPQVLQRQQQQPSIALEGSFAIAKQKAVGLELMQAIGFNFEHGRLDESHHPFCGGVPQDVRITTRYKETEFITAAMGICHETGHAMYEMGLPKEWLSQPVGEALGMSIHESQSLLIEMQACRSLPFMQFLAPIVTKHFGEHPGFTPENLHRIYTRVKPGYIRVDADELTYPLHIILRYELEKQLIAGDLRVADLPDAWDSYMQQFLGLSTKDNYHDGVMQDVHWPAGLFGYFPAYTLGALVAAQLFATAQQQSSEIPQGLATGDFTRLFIWLRENIHSKGSLFNFDELLTQATGESLNPKYYIEHVTRRYGA